MLAICSRVIGAFGWKVPSPKPPTMPSLAAQFTAVAYQSPSATSVKPALSAMVTFYSRASMATIMARVVLVFGSNVVALVPVIRPSL